MEPPESLRPQVVEGFDGRVVIGLAQRNEQDLDTHIQTQTHHLAEHWGDENHPKRPIQIDPISVPIL
jgi:hypothetical protein